jgi:hypothetical protein
MPVIKAKHLSLCKETTTLRSEDHKIHKNIIRVQNTDIFNIKPDDYIPSGLHTKRQLDCEGLN